MPDTTPHVPTDMERKTVESMSAYGIPQLEIAKVIGIDDKTLRKHYRKELDTACAKANAKVAQALFRKATDKDDTSAMIFWLKTRGKWSETIKNENRYVDKEGEDLHKRDRELLKKIGIETGE